jgi:cobyrinic acid a,c-diamide synthase
MTGSFPNARVNNPGAVVIAAPRSGSGKTTVALGLMRALKRKGLKVQPYKAGPDYLDGSWHQAVCGTASYNLDTWMVDRDVLRHHFGATLQGHDIGIVEGVMGLYDGYEGTITGSTADLAMLLGIPVVLVVDCKGASGSVAPLTAGFRDFRKECRFAGVVCNNVASDTHEKYLREAFVSTDIPVLGCIRRDESLRLEHRHLGLVAAKDHEDKVLEAMADAVLRQVDLALLVAAASHVEFPGALPAAKPCTCRIAVARDAAFHFYYQANLDLLIREGAELVFFSPLSDTQLPDDIHGLYLGGGYPEVHAEQLADNGSMRRCIKEFSHRSGCVFAECGGYMYLGAHLQKDGVPWPMCGVFGCSFSMADGKRKMLGYREATTTSETLLGPKGTLVRGHEFHYSYCDQIEEHDAPFQTTPRNGHTGQPAGRLTAQTLGSYLHIHFLSNRSVAASFVSACQKFKQGAASV